MISTQNPLETNSNSSLVYVGTQSKADEDGIFLFRLDTSTGELTKLSSIKAGEKPNYLITDPTNHFLYAVNKDNEGGVKAFSINQKDGSLTFLNEQSCPGGPCHLTLDKTNKVLIIANYAKGRLFSFPIQENGRIGPLANMVQHHGSSVNPDRQEGSHTHFVTTDPANKFVFAVDLGLDQILGYRLDIPKGSLTPNEPAIAFKGKPGSGPRHLIFHPNKSYAYLINELGGTMVALEYDDDKGVFKEIQTIKTLPDDFKGENLCAAVHVSSDGRYLYGSNRGHDSIVVYSIEETTGRLKLVEYVSSGGKQPRDFNIDINGRFMIVGNQDTNNVRTCKIVKESGKLVMTDVNIEVPSPVCFHIVPDFTNKG